MSPTQAKQQVYVKRLDVIRNKVSSLRLQLNNLQRRVTRIDGSLNRLSSRIQQIRKMNYRVMVSLETDLTSLSEGWSTLKPTVTSIITSTVPVLVSEIKTVESELAQRRLTSNCDVSDLAKIEFKVSSINARVSDLASRVSGALGDTGHRLQSLDQEVGVAERTLNLTVGSSFRWKQGESPILSVNAKDLDNDIEGILSLTSQRFIFEAEKEVVLKKRFFIVTQKKKVRELIVDKPIGMVDNIVKGRVGILAGQGLYITFKPNSGQQELKLDTKGGDTDLVLRFHKFISTGEADQELATTKPSKTDAAKPAPIICPICGAPYSEEIYRGQTSLKCNYCSATILVAS